MKRILALILTTLVLFGTVTLAQAGQTPTTTATTTPPTVTNQTDPLADLIANETNAAIKEKLQTIAQNRQTIRGLRETFATKVQALKQLIANMPEDDDNEALEKARDIVEGFEERTKSGNEHDQKILRSIEGLRNHAAKIRQKAAEQDQNAANGETKRARIRNGRQGDDDERKNGNGKQNIRQNRRGERNEQKILRRVDRIIKSQERIIGRLERRIEKIDDLIDELTP